MLWRCILEREPHAGNRVSIPVRRGELEAIDPRFEVNGRIPATLRPIPPPSSGKVGNLQGMDAMMKAMVGAFLLILLAVSTAQAQSQGAAPDAAANSLTPAEADRALSVLTDAGKRAQLIETLQSIAKATAPPAVPANPAPATAPPAAPLALQPDSLGAELVVQAAAGRRTSPIKS